MEPIVAYVGYPEYTNSADDDSEWIINENVTFDYSLS